MSKKGVENNDKLYSNSEYIRMYYEHQYDRMAKQEEQRHSIANIVVTLSVLAFTFGFSGAQEASFVRDVILSLIVIGANLASIEYMKRTKSWIRTHRERAKEVLLKAAPDLYYLDTKISENNKVYQYRYGRGSIMRSIHWLLIGASIVPIIRFVVYIRTGTLI